MTIPTYKAVPSILIVAPRGKTVEETTGLIPKFSSAQDIEIGRVAELEEVEPGNFEEAIRIKDELVRLNKYKSLHQFTNPLNIECHRQELFNELRISSYMIDKISAFVAGTGTGGTLMGVHNGLRNLERDTKIVAVEPSESPVMSGGE